MGEAQAARDAIPTAASASATRRGRKRRPAALRLGELVPQMHVSAQMSRWVPSTEYELRRFVETELGGSATPLYVVPVRHAWGGRIWEAPVHVFELAGNPGGARAYAWTCPYDRMDRSVLHTPEICGPIEAVRSVLHVSGWAEEAPAGSSKE